jgi:5-methylcytosine-specific restriction endonuclease McrA
MALSRSALTSKGGTTKWRRIRQQVINRDRCCQLCGTEEMLTVDHIVPRRLGGDDNLLNLQVLCSGCNGSKGGRFFEGSKTPMTLPAFNSPENESSSHYRLDSDENDQ